MARKETIVDRHAQVLPHSVKLAAGNNNGLPGVVRRQRCAKGKYEHLRLAEGTSKLPTQSYTHLSLACCRTGFLDDVY